MRCLVAPFVFVLLALTSCRDGTGPDTALKGTYSLETVDGFRIPVRDQTFENGSYTHVQWGAIEISSDDSLRYRMIRLYFPSPVFGGAETVYSERYYKYEHEGDSLRMFDEDEEIVATVGTRSITVHHGAVDWVFLR